MLTAFRYKHADNITFLCPRISLVLFFLSLSLLLTLLVPLCHLFSQQSEKTALLHKQCAFPGTLCSWLLSNGAAPLTSPKKWGGALGIWFWVRRDKDDTMGWGVFRTSLLVYEGIWHPLISCKNPTARPGKGPSILAQSDHRGRRRNMWQSPLPCTKQLWFHNWRAHWKLPQSLIWADKASRWRVSQIPIYSIRMCFKSVSRTIKHSGTGYARECWKEIVELGE